MGYVPYVEFVTHRRATMDDLFMFVLKKKNKTNKRVVTILIVDITNTD
jgi:hypothetical protein